MMKSSSDSILSMHFKMNTPKVVHEGFDDNEVVIINLDSGSYYSLDKIGAEIWMLIESGASIGEIIECINCSYESGELNIENSVSRFVEELREENLIVPDTEKTDGKPAAGENTKSKAGGARLSFQEPVLQKYTDMQDLLLLDPIHEVDETGWPKNKEDS